MEARNGPSGAIVAAAAVVSVLFAISVLLFAVSTTKKKVDHQAQVVLATCAVNKAIIDAGLNTIRQGVLLRGDKLSKGRFVPGPLTKALGPAFPSYPDRVKRADMIAREYEDGIARVVIKATGHKGLLLSKNNKLDCSRLKP